MIIKKKLNQFLPIKLIGKIISKLIIFTGTLSLLATILLFFYYFNSGMYERYKPPLLMKKINDKIIYKYLGFNFYKIDDYFSNYLKSLKYFIFNNDLDNAVITIDQKNLYNLELQRKNKLDKSSMKADKFSMATLNYRDNNYDIKLRVKGDRVLHWYDKDQTSYRIDLRGDDRVWGLEEFSVQKPITRNYIHEYIFHKFLDFNDLISLKYFFINLSLNDTEQGIYAVEEGFSKELIERNKKRNGPIFGVKESVSQNYPNIEYDLYSFGYWLKNYPDLLKSAKSKLNKLLLNQIDVNEIFDMEKWATYFAVIDLTGTFHGSIPKSVKLYYNPVTAKFEPIGFDGHYNSDLFQNFLVLDFIDEMNKNCDYICSERDWYLRFFKNSDQSINRDFLDMYLKKLNQISSEKFISKFYTKYLNEINFYNDQFLSETSKKDKVLYKGFGLYLFDENYLMKRSKYIKKRIYEYEKKLTKKNLSNQKDLTRLDLLNIDVIEKHNENYILKKDLEINNDYFLAANKKLNIQEGVNIFFNKDVSILSEGSIFFNGTKEKPITIFSKKNIGSLIFSNNNFEFNNVVFKNLSYPKIKSKILYGGINIINSKVKIIDTKIISSGSEDAINIISSDSVINNLRVENIFADAIDIDFGTLEFNNIICINVDNDCLDVSGAKVKGKFLVGKYIKDKGLSFGENSRGEILNIDFQNTKLGVAVKDGSKLKLSNYKLINNEYDVAVFNKKKEYENSSLNLNEPLDKSELTYLIGFNNKIVKENINLTKKIENKIINEIFY